jgi:hypothetical protein
MQYYMMNSKSSSWTIGCSQHGYSYVKNLWDANTERVAGLTIRQALNAFVFSQQRVHAE